MYKLHIEPTLKKADIRIVNSYNPIATLTAPTYEFKAKLTKTNPAEFSKLIIDSITQLFGADMKIIQESKNYNEIFMLPPEASESDNFIEEKGKTQKLTYIRIRNCEGKYSLMFSDVYTEDSLLISPNLEFDVSIRTFSGLLCLGYKIESVLNRNCKVFKMLNNDNLKVSIDVVKELNEQAFVHIYSKDKMKLLDFAALLGISKSEMIPKTYIQIYKEFLATSECLKK